MKLFAVVWIALGTLFVAGAAFLALTHAAGPASTGLMVTFGCIGVPFLAFGVWGLYQELRP